MRCGHGEAHLHETNNWRGQKIWAKVIVLITLWVDNADVETSGQHYIAIEAHLTEFRAPHLVNFRLQKNADNWHHSSHTCTQY